MVTRPVAVAEVIGAVVAAVAAVACWRAGTTPAEFEPVLADTPSFSVVQYSGPWISAAFAAALVAGLLVLDAWHRRR